jgi:acyl-CoA dehydrogenase
MIDFTLSENDRRILAAVREEALVARRYARHFDENEHEFPPDELPEAKDFPGPWALMRERTAEDSGLGVISMLVSAGQTWGDYSVRMRRTKGGLGNAALRAAGTPEQQKKWGHLTLAMAITEPGCGSDPSLVQTTAVLDEARDEWVLNGEKIFVTTGCRAEGVVVWATLDKSAGRAGIKSFLVEKGAPGFIVAHKEKKLGIRADDTAAYVFQDCRIPRGNLLGGDETIPKASSGGFRGVMKTFNMTRPAVAALGLGMAEAALDFTREKLLEAGVDLSHGPGLHGQSAAAREFQRLEALHEAALLTVLRAAWLSEQGKPNNLEASVAKAKGGAAVREITQGCIELMGPLGVSREHLLEKWFRDVRITDIYEGTGQIQHLTRGNSLLAQPSGFSTCITLMPVWKVPAGTTTSMAGSPVAATASVKRQPPHGAPLTSTVASGSTYQAPSRKLAAADASGRGRLGGMPPCSAARRSGSTSRSGWRSGPPMETLRGSAAVSVTAWPLSRTRSRSCALVIPSLPKPKRARSRSRPGGRSPRRGLTQRALSGS